MNADLKQQILKICPDYQPVQVPLVSEDGNAFSIIGRVTKALQRAGHGDLVKLYQEHATKGDYDNLLAVTMEFCDEQSQDEESEED